MEAKGYQLTVFADDIQISHDQNVDKDVVFQELSELLQPLGLELALNKCSSTQDGGEITFLGQTFSQSSTVSLAERMTAKIDKYLKVLDASPITNHQKYLFLRSVVLPKVNYAPLVDFAPKTVLETNTVLSTRRFSSTQAISSPSRTCLRRSKPISSQILLRRADQKWSCPHYTTTSCKPSKKQFLLGSVASSKL
ncbi:Reverse_transcriptase/endonuclease [Hexamita inflata]|uniref:Putative n=1 Tax=Hexamita inflata TaxID=28002 RepID=A0AA86PNH0_9EUKA|nr:Reverse transcriptase/endonuclease [Hexamita inflata]